MASSGSKTPVKRRRAAATGRVSVGAGASAGQSKITDHLARGKKSRRALLGDDVDSGAKAAGAGAGAGGEGGGADPYRSTIPRWVAVNGVSVDDVEQRVMPLLYDGLDTSAKQEYSISTSDVKVLRESMAESTVGAHEASNHKKNFVYGEVLPDSVFRDVLPRLRLGPSDVFYDLGSGTGKIPLQVALQTACAKAKGIELSVQRHSVAEAASKRLAAYVAGEALDAKAPSVTLSTKLRSRLENVAGRWSVEFGDACASDLSDATVVFVNNVCFEADLMARLTEKLASLPKLRTVVVLRKLCHRHSDRLCAARKRPCVRFGYPDAAVGRVSVTWAEGTTVYAYNCDPLAAKGKGKA